MSERETPNTAPRARTPLLAAALAAGALAGAPAAAQDALDVCGCADMPSLGAFDNCDTNTYPPGAYASGSYTYIPLPEDGVLVFDSMRIRACRSGFDGVAFVRNAANTPVTLLVKDWVYTSSDAGFDVRGVRGGNGTSGRNGGGGAPGPGGFRGGEGGHVDTAGTRFGGPGLGAGGGGPGPGGASRGGAGLFFGADTALPLTGGSGGGGSSESGSGSSCSAGGGGGGGGALLVAANGYIRNDGNIWADGGGGGSPGNSSCAGYGGRGGGGTIRLMSPRVYGSGTLYARGGWNDAFGTGGNGGLIRIESFDDTHTSSNNVNPPARRTRVISPLVNPVASTVAITAIDGQPVPQPPRGSYGLIDLLVDTPGFISLRVDTQGVPGGTTVEVAVKPDVGGDAVRNEVTLEPANCDDAGACFAVTSFDLGEGAYFAEAAATYRTPSP